MAEKSLELLASSIKQLASEVQDARHRGSEDSEAFEKLIDALDGMRADLVGPMQWLGTLFAPPDYAALQTAFLHHVFEHVPTDGKDTASASIHVKDLSELVEIPADILLRIMRLLATNKIFLEIDECVFCHTTLSAGMVDEMVSARLGSFFNDIFKASSSLSDAIDAGKRSAWEVRFGMPMYEYLEKIPESDRELMTKSVAIS
ncbi:O-methyltransferase [Botrytis cinerea]